MTTFGALVRSAHPLPGIAVTALTAVLAVGVGGFGWRLLPIVVAVFSGQMVVGWTNDLVDRERDAQTHRSDKPIAMGTIRPVLVERWAATTFAVCVIASLACGWIPGLLHLVFGVGAAVAYNVVLKATAASWLPYTIAFGTLPIVVHLSVEPGALPPTWMIAVGGLLGFGAHLVNVLPDLADDDATGVRGFPHRLPRRAVAPIAAGALVVATLVGVVGSSSKWGWTALPVAVILAVVACTGQSKTPFYAAIGIAAVDVVVLVAA
ncbi:UbiA family prenyltransferase [Actinomycetes bacterium M1A6_2h]